MLPSQANARVSVSLSACGVGLSMNNHTLVWDLETIPDSRVRRSREWAGLGGQDRETDRFPEGDDFR